MLSEPQESIRALTPLHAEAVPVAGVTLAAVPMGWTAGASRLLTAVFVIVALEALYTVPKYTWDHTAGGRRGVGILLALGIAAIAAALLWTGRHRLEALLRSVGERLAAIPRGRWLALAIGIGIALRLAWIFLFPAPPTADGLAYYNLAERLAHGLTYQTPKGEWAQWPPGYPFLLLAHFKIFGVGLLAVTVANLLLFAGTILVVYALATRRLGALGEEKKPQRRAAL